MLTVSVITMNEEGAIAKVVGDIRGVAPDAEILVVDSSKDRTPEIAASLGCRVLRQFPPQGYGPAMDRAVREAAGEIVITLDCDDTYPVEQSLLFNLGLRPFYGGRKVAILDDADFLNVTGANCLLKTLEEPPTTSVLILISSSADKQLPTIRSRAQIIRFRPLASDVVARLLVERQIVSDASEAKKLAAYSGGSLTRASELADPALWEFRREILKQLGQLALSSVALAQSTIKFVDEAGKDAPPRRARLRLAIGFSTGFFRQLVRRLSGLQSEGDAELIAAVESAAGHGAWHLESATDAVERCLQAAAEVDRNANQHTLIEAWLDEVASGQSAVGSGQ